MKKAFTLIELMVVVGIIGILMAVLLGSFRGTSESARAARCQTNMRNLAMAVQSVGVENEYYPFAGSFTWSDNNSSTRKKATTGTKHGWITWPEGGSAYIAPSETDVDSRKYSITTGSVWKAIGGVYSTYCCPSHQQEYRKAGITVDPLWSYAMNAYFMWNSGGNFHSSRHGRYYSSFRRRDRVLLFGELPFVTVDGVQTPNLKSGASQENDPILQYSGSDGGGSEAIGFNHTGQKMRFANVAFADGHVEKLVMPKDFTSAKAQELTKWLCEPWDDDGNDIDVIYDSDSQTYKQSSN